MFWRTLLTTVLLLMLLGRVSLWRMSLGRINRPSITSFFSIRVSETKSFTRLRMVLLFLLAAKGLECSQEMKRSCQAQAH